MIGRPRRSTTLATRVARWRSVARCAVALLALFASWAPVVPVAYAQGPNTVADGPGDLPVPEEVPSATESDPAPKPEARTEAEKIEDQAELGGTTTKPSDRVSYVLQSVEIRGNHTTRAAVILRYVPFKPGQVIDVDDPRIELTRYRLLGTGFFRDVQFSLRKGYKRGYVILVIDVVERNTFIVNDVWMGVSQDVTDDGQLRPLTPYAGLDVAETNLLGTGITVGGAIGVTEGQIALRVRFLDPAFLGSHWMTSGTMLYNGARDFFGNSDVRVEYPANEGGEEFGSRVNAAVVDYNRFGGVVGIGHDLALSTQLWAYYRLESIDVTRMPLAAVAKRGATLEPINFEILPGRSILSTVSATLQVDQRDTPFLPTRGMLIAVNGEVSLAPTGSDYAYERIDVEYAQWWKLPWGHVFQLRIFGGAISGDPPFFEEYYVGDLSDFLPSRILGMNFDRRPPPNFLGTDIIEVRYGRYAAKLSTEYRIPIYRGGRSIYGIDFFGGIGIFGLANPRDLSNPPTGYSGAARIPMDLTGNFGIRMDTAAGGFVLAFSNIVGFIPIRQEDHPK